MAFADDLVVKLQVDVGVFVPTSLTQAVAVEFLQTGELVVEKLEDALLAARIVVVLGQPTDVHHMIAHTGHQLYRLVGKYVHLLYLVAPQLVFRHVAAHGGHVVAGVPFGDVARGDGQVGDVTRRGHDAVAVVDIVILAVLALHTHHGSALCYTDVDGGVLCLIALGIAHKRVLLQRILDGAGVDAADELPLGIETRPLQCHLDVLGGQEPHVVVVGDVDLHFLAGEFPVIVLVERCDGEYEVYRQENIQCDEYVPLTYTHPSLSFLSDVSVLYPG